MSLLRPLRGGCICGRNRYIITVPQNSIQDAQVLFSTDRLHQEHVAAPLAAYLRVPLSWLHSATFPLFDDETHSMIRRVYTHPRHENARRNFCGFCGTPLSYWSDEPRDEAEYINLTLGSLLREDLQDLEDMGLIPEESEVEADARNQEGTAMRQYFGVPWFESMVEGTRLGRLRRTRVTKKSGDGMVKMEWEIIDQSDGLEGNKNADAETASGLPEKRKLQDQGD